MAATKSKTTPKTDVVAKPEEQSLVAPGLPPPVQRRGITEAQWRTLMNNLYPGAAPESVMMVWDYCVARQLDPLKKPCHIVPMKVKDSRTGEHAWRDVVMPGIYEYRTTAMRTGLYMGHSTPEYGDFVKCAGVEAPTHCDITVYRFNKASGQRVEFPVRVLFRECVATKDDGKANQRWSRAPVQMLTKCAEAAALREAFPDELGGQSTVEELEGHILEGNFSAIEGTTVRLPGKPRTEAPRAVATDTPDSTTAGGPGDEQTPAGDDAATTEASAADA